MYVLLLLIAASLALAFVFLFGFIWAVRAGQFEDTATPSMRLLTEDANPRSSARPDSSIPHEVRITDH
ncbi:MAG TPA: cbb3-type cytochrome oxidase assembly protein CcoS [Candidatus Dormibacteraeota bacterium]|nr:cbb3-type cytochrome oxidase assembly protein CcoS [Candidatus Dormibacteraeota bacterium]